MQNKRLYRIRFSDMDTYVDIERWLTDSEVELFRGIEREMDANTDNLAPYIQEIVEIA